MNPQNKAFLDQHRDVYEEVIRAKTATKAGKVKADLIRILREEFIPGYVVMEDCVSCLFDVVRTLYQRYDRWLEENAAHTAGCNTLKAVTAECEPKRRGRRRK